MAAAMPRRAFTVTALAVLFALGGEASAATATWTRGAGTNNWNNSGNWDCGCVPGTGANAGMDVAIGAGAGTVAINAGLGSVSLGKLDISGGTVNGSAATVTTSGAITVSGGSLNPGSGAFTCGGACVVSGGIWSFAGASASLSCASGLSASSGTFTGNTGTLTITGNLTLSGSATVHTSTTTTTISGNVSQGSTGTLDLNGTTSVTGSFTQSANGAVTGPSVSLTVGTVGTPTSLAVSAGTFTGAAGAITVNGDLAVTSTGAFTGPSGSSTLTVTGNVSYSSSGALNFRSGSSPTISITGSFTASTGAGTVTGPGTSGSLTVGTVGTPRNLGVGAGAFNGTGGTITVNGGLALSGSGSFQGSSTTTSITGDVTHDSSGTLDLNGGTTNLTGAWTQSAGTTTVGSHALTVGTVMVPKNVTLTGGAFNGAAGAITITGGLSLSGSAAFKGSTSTTTVSGSVSHGSSGTLDLNGGTTSVVGSWTQSSGTTTVGSHALTVGVVMVPTSVTLTGGAFNGNAGAVTVTGDLALSGTGAFQGSSTTTTVDGNLSLAGSASYTRNGAGTLVVLGSLSQSGGTFTGGGSSGIQIGGDLGPLSGGTFTATSGTMTLSGVFNRTSAANTYNANGGTILFNASTSKSHTFSGAALGQVIFNDGLVGYWALDEAAASHPDSGGYANDGTLTGTYAAASTRPAVAFADTAAIALDGSTNYLTLGTGSLPAASAAQTISAWVSFSGAATTQSIVAMTASGSAIKLGLGGGNVRVLRSDGTVLAQVAAPSAGAWHHLAYVYDPTLAGASKDKIYVDGVATTGTSSAHDGATPTAAYMGATSPGTDLLAASLDEVRIYARALGAREMTDLAFGRLPSSGAATHTFSDALDTSGGGSNGHFVLASGTVTGTSTLNVGGSWLNYGGRFAGTGLVTLSSVGTRSLLTGGESFPNLTINATGKYTLLDRLWVSGTLNIAGASASFNDGGYVFHAGTFTTSSATGYQVSTGTAVIDGRSNQTITAQNFNSLRLEAPNESGLAGYWKLDEGQETTARDVSGNGNSGALSSSGASWAGASGTISFDNAAAASFDGTSGYVSAGATGLPAAGAAQTISVWAKFSSSAATQTLVAMTAGGSAIKLGLGGGNVRVLRADGTVLAQVAAPSAGAWHHLAYVYDPTASGVNRDEIYVDGTATTGTNSAHDGASPTATFLGASSAAADFFNGQLDDVRVYTQALTSAQVGSLNVGRYAGTGIATTVTVGHNVAVALSGVGIFIDSGVLYTSTFTVTSSATGSPGLVNSGTLHIGSNIVNYDGGLTINPMGTLLMDESGGQFQPGANSIVAINGTLRATNQGALIQRDGSGQRFYLRVGTTPNATPTLNITGLTVKDVFDEGMRINYDTSAITTFTRFDNVAFSRGATGAGTQYLQIYAPVLYLASNGCQFGVGQGAASLPASAVTLTGNGTADGETRAIFGNATCATSKTDGTTNLCVTTWKTDDDADGDGVGNTPASNGAVAQFMRGAETDTAGTIVGFPTAAFDWNTFTYYSTYAAYNTASGTSPVIYVRDTAGNAKYSWTGSAGETIVGTPRWITVGATHYLYVAMASGKVYRLIDNASTSLTQDGSWAPYDCSCTIVTPLTMDTSNLYWGGTQGGAQKLWSLSQTTETQPMGSPFTVTPTITSTAPVIYSQGGVSYLFLAVVGHILEVNVSNQTLVADNTNPGSASIWGRIAIGSKNAWRVLAGDDGGTFWSIDPTNFAGTNKQWSFSIPSDTTKSSPYYDYGNNAVYFGTEGGKVYALNAATGAALTGYPITPGTASDAIRPALLYFGGVIAAGTTTGKVFFIDRNNGSGPAFIRQYYFGPTETVSGIALDTSSNRYMVSTSDASTNDGKLYYIDLIPDPTAGST